MDANVDTRRNINKPATNTVTDAETVPGDITGHSKQITYTCTTDKHRPFTGQRQDWITATEFTTTAVPLYTGQEKKEHERLQ